MGVSSIMNDAGRIGFVVKGTYDNTATYDFLDVVYYNNATYVAKKLTVGNKPQSSSEFWQALIDGNKDSVTAEHVIYDNENSGLQATNTQDAIDEVKVAVDTSTANAKSYTDTKISDLINGAPQALDTLKEVAEVIAENEDVVEALNASIGTKANTGDLTAHTGNKNNPHGVTKSQVGLGNVDNVADANKSVKYAASATKDGNGNNISETYIKKISRKKYIIIGDSYTEGYTPDGNVTSWATYLKNYLGVSDSNITISYKGGAGFVNGTTFKSLLSNIADNSAVTDIIVAGGYNDFGVSFANIKTAIQEFKTYAATHFPNAEIKVAFIGNTKKPSMRFVTSVNIDFYQRACRELNIRWLGGCEFALRDYINCYSSDGIHPNTAGQLSIASCVYNALLGYGNNYYLSYQPSITSVMGNVNSALNTDGLGAEINNGVLHFSSQRILEFELNSLNIGYANGANGVNLLKITGGLIYGSIYEVCTTTVQCIIRSNGVYYTLPSYLSILDGVIRLYPFATNSAGNGFLSLTAIEQIMILPFSASFDCFMC